MEIDCCRHAHLYSKRGRIWLTTPVEVSLENILVTTDFSAASLSALTCITPIAKMSNSVVHILHVIHPRGVPIASPEAQPDISEQVQMDAERRLASLDNVVGTIPHRMWLREGELWKALQDVIKSEHIDLVAVGASGKSDLKKLFVGSVAEEIVRKATPDFTESARNRARPTGNARIEN